MWTTGKTASTGMVEPLWAMFALYGAWGQIGVVHRATGYRTCFTRAVSSCTKLYTDLSSRIRRAIFEVAWITVV